MGRSDQTLYQQLYYPNISLKGEIALLGFKDNQYFPGDCYDMQLKNWNINSNWELNKKYDTIICLRTAYFAKNPKDFIRRCYEHLNEDGMLYVDWGLGDHWRFENYKIGWVKNGEHEYAYKEDNFLWSTTWNDKFLEDEQFKVFEKATRKFGYDNVKKTIYEEVPNVLEFERIDALFKTGYTTLTLWPEKKPQLYILVYGVKR